MKPKINLRLEVAGAESLLPLFKNCLNSYLKYFEIKKLLIYTTKNLSNEVQEFSERKANEIMIYDIDEFYEENKDKYPKIITEVLDYSKDKYWLNDSERSFFYQRVKWVMDYSLINESFVVSDIDIRILDYIKPIVDWMNSDYILYNADFLDDYYGHNPTTVEKFGGESFFKPLPQFNPGWMCIPTGIKFDLEELFEIVNQEIDDWCIDMNAIAIILIKNKIKTKLLPRELMVTKEDEVENKTLAHQSPYGLLRK